MKNKAAVDEYGEHVLEYIRGFIDENGIPPSHREIARDCYISRPTVVRCLDRLEARGKIARIPHKARGIRLVEGE